MSDCLFCKIVDGTIPSKKVYEDDTLLAFYDVSPIAPVHILIIPKQHISSLNDLSSENSQIVAKIFELIPRLAEQLGLQNGYRVVSNYGNDGGQTVMHLHFHLLGGKPLNWEV